jgi:hypothetical protein
MKSVKLCILIGLLFLCVDGQSRAGDLALTFSNSPEANNILNFTVGWQFTVNQTIQVDGLGYFDRSADGLASAHDVAIWTSTGTGPLASATVPSGTSASLINSFRVTPIVPTTLPPGSYVIGGFTASGDLVADTASSISTIPQITFVENRGTTGSSAGLAFPTMHYPTQGLGFFGPNFTVVPEPFSVALGAVAFVGMLLFGARRRALHRTA